MFWKKDYLEGSMVMTSEELVDLLFNVLGPPEPSPYGVTFTKDHILSMMPDSKALILTKENQDAFIDKYSRTTRWYDWTPEVGDCDSITSMFLGDMIERATQLKFPYGQAAWDLSYVSHSLRDRFSSEKFSGYHSAPLLVSHTDKYPNFRIRQPETLRSKGRWQSTPQEVRFWTIAEGKH